MWFNQNCPSIEPNFRNYPIFENTLKKALDQKTLKKALDQKTLKKALDQKTLKKALPKNKIFRNSITDAIQKS